MLDSCLLQDTSSLWSPEGYSSKVFMSAVVCPCHGQHHSIWASCWSPSPHHALCSIQTEKDRSSSPAASFLNILQFKLDCTCSQSKYTLVISGVWVVGFFSQAVMTWCSNSKAFNASSGYVQHRSCWTVSVPKQSKAHVNMGHLVRGA